MSQGIWPCATPSGSATPAASRGSARTNHTVQSNWSNLSNLSKMSAEEYVRRKSSMLSVSTQPQADIHVKSTLRQAIELVTLLLVLFVLSSVITGLLKEDYDWESFYPIHIGFRFSGYKEGPLDWLC